MPVHRPPRHRHRHHPRIPRARSERRPCLYRPHERNRRALTATAVGLVVALPAVASLISTSAGSHPVARATALGREMLSYVKNDRRPAARRGGVMTASTSGGSSGLLTKNVTPRRCGARVARHHDGHCQRARDPIIAIEPPVARSGAADVANSPLLVRSNEAGALYLESEACDRPRSSRPRARRKGQRTPTPAPFSRPTDARVTRRSSTPSTSCAASASRRSRSWSKRKQP